MTLTVNGQEIPDEAIQYELNRLVQFYSQHMSPDQVKSQMDALTARAREQAVGAKLLMTRAQQLDLPVPTERIDEKMEGMITGSGGREQFEQILQQQNLTEDMVRASVENGCRVDMLVEKICEAVPEPTEEEMKAHFEEHQEEYQRADRAEAQHILIKPASDSEADRETARSKLLEIRKKIEEGSDFAEQAGIHSECPSGKRNGASLGWFGRGMMVPEFDNAVFDMEVGALSDIVETPFGFHVIYKSGAEEGGDASYEEVSDAVRDFLRHARRGETISTAVKELADKAVIEGL